MKVISISAVGSFNKTRAALEFLQGTDGDLGVQLINGYTTSFTQGLSGPSDLYRVTLKAMGQGSANITIQRAQDAAFANSTPKGLKIGHTNSNGNPAFFQLSFSACCYGRLAADGFKWRRQSEL